MMLLLSNQFNSSGKEPTNTFALGEGKQGKSECLNRIQNDKDQRVSGLDTTGISEGFILNRV